MQRQLICCNDSDHEEMQIIIDKVDKVRKDIKDMHENP